MVLVENLVAKSSVSRLPLRSPDAVHAESLVARSSVTQLLSQDVELEESPAAKLSVRQRQNQWQTQSQDVVVEENLVAKPSVKQKQSQDVELEESPVARPSAKQSRLLSQKQSQDVDVEESPVAKLSAKQRRPPKLSPKLSQKNKFSTTTWACRHLSILRQRNNFNSST